MIEQNSVSIRRHGNVIGIAPAGILETIKPAITWMKQERDWRAGKINPATGRRFPYYKRTPEPLYKVSGNDIITFAGLYPAVRKVLVGAGYTVSYTEQTSPPEFKLREIPTHEYRAGQREAIAAMLSCREGRIVSPTAWGKSQAIMLICKYADHKTKILVVAPGLSAVNSIHKRLVSAGVSCGLVTGAEKKVQRITVASADSMMKLDVNAFDVILFDEVHRAAAASYRSVLATVKNARMYGFTATPTGRTDNGDILTEALFGEIIYHMPYDEAVAAGNVVPMVVVMLQTDGAEMHDSTPEDKTRFAVWRNDTRNSIFAAAAKAAASQGQTLVLVSTIEHLLHLRRFLPDWPVVYGTPPIITPPEQLMLLNGKDRREAMRANMIREEMERQNVPILAGKDVTAMAAMFSEGKLRKAIATDVWGTAVDFPGLQFVIRVDGQSSVIDSTQFSGRAARLHGGKVCGIVIDGEDGFDRSLQRRAASRLKVYMEKKWRVIRNVTLEQCSSLFGKLISGEATSVTAAATPNEFSKPDLPRSIHYARP